MGWQNIGRRSQNFEGEAKLGVKGVNDDARREFHRGEVRLRTGRHQSNLSFSLLPRRTHRGSTSSSGIKLFLGRTKEARKLGEVAPVSHIVANHLPSRLYLCPANMAFGK